ncbi:MAG: hypothetical protein AAF514_22975, partial [Verrucomicrobiota bacterium]
MNLSSSNVDPDSLILVGTYPTVTQAHERGLVVLAMSLPYWIARGTEGFNILVSVDQGDRIAREIALYDAEMEGWNPAVDYEIPNYKSRIIYPYVISILLAFAFLYQMREGPAWIDRWCVDSQAILDRRAVRRRLPRPDRPDRRTGRYRPHRHSRGRGLPRA